MDANPKWIKKDVFSKIYTCGDVWAGPEYVKYLLPKFFQLNRSLKKSFVIIPERAILLSLR